MSESPEQTTSNMERSNGRVKWFNNRAGYGFITVGNGDKEGDDIFVHHSALNVGQEQYKYLVQGEYVEFDWSETDNSDEHKWQASNVCGMNGGKLMCETRNEIKSFKNTENETSTQPYKLRGGGPRSSSSITDENGVEWMLVKKKQGNPGNRQQRQPRQYRQDRQ